MLNSLGYLQANTNYDGLEKMESIVRPQGDYYCSCKSKFKSKAGNHYSKPWRLHTTKVDDEGICLDCGHYAFYKTEEILLQ